MAGYNPRQVNKGRGSASTCIAAPSGEKGKGGGGEGGKKGGRAHLLDVGPKQLPQQRHHQSRLPRARCAVEQEVRTVTGFDELLQVEAKVAVHHQLVQRPRAAERRGTGTGGEDGHGRGKGGRGSRQASGARRGAEGRRRTHRYSSTHNILRQPQASCVAKTCRTFGARRV